jgi:hypothetical protein
MATRVRLTRLQHHRSRPAPPRPSRPKRPPASGFDREYWLAHCEGFRVDAEGGRLGFVEAVHADAWRDEPLLVVRAGRLGRRLLHVPASEVAFIVPRAERIWLASPVRIAGSEAA